MALPQHRITSQQKRHEVKAGAVVIGCMFAGIVLLALLVGLSNRMLWKDVGALHLAAAEGNVAECERLVKSGVPVDAPDGSGDTPLDWAVYAANVDAVRKLIELGADVNHANQLGITPLMCTATPLRGHHLRGTQEERSQVARVLIEHGAQVNRADGNGRAIGGGQTALHFAAADRNAGLVRMLLAAGANRYIQTDHGYTPLDMAKFPDHAPNEEVIRALKAR